MSVMYFREHRAEDGSIAIECVNPLPRIPVTEEFLRDSDPGFLTRDGDTFTLHCMNGTWTYQILEPTSRRPDSRTLTAVLIESEAA
ncbi:hypothetical protein [Nocardia xishanensis]|uniref:hypothetical protein n=1 Tax=Nocardia xishanensis TaxID=238964 RepID=UPI000B23195F|nr:hypothetical protein [Nocardia xishanensis]